MDIFTTVLKRVVQTPIKPVNTKVKAPSKGAATDALTEDFDHLEHHEKYTDNDSHNKNKQNKASNISNNAVKKEDKSGSLDIKKSELESESNENKPPHVDIFV